MTDHPRNITRHAGAITRGDRERLLGQRGAVVWFTGLSGSGKSTVAHNLEERLAAAGRLTYVLDGDNERHAHGRRQAGQRADEDAEQRRPGDMEQHDRLDKVA
ncbi:MAG: adenylyl-sulfate kinase, partial [Planctomycetes bacterium]|nr:adenylyl-sulfate kinase [Planctomycetota bacterium]